MSTTDKTRQQLMTSMRKTKAAAAGKTTPRSPVTRAANRTVKSAKKTAAGAAVKRPVKVAVGSSTGTRDSYQAGRRVWPD